MAAARAGKLGVGVFPLALGGCQDRSARVRVGSVAHLSGAAKGADEGHVDCQLSPVPERQVVCEDFDLACVGDRDREVHARERHVDRDAGTGLAADAGDRAFDGCSSCPEDASGGACGTVVAVRVECQATPTPGRAAAQGGSEPPLQQGAEMRVAELEFRAGRKGCDYAAAVWASLG